MLTLSSDAQVHPFAAHVQPNGDRVHAALHHHVRHLPVCAGTAPAMLRKGNTSTILFPACVLVRLILEDDSSDRSIASPALDIW